MRKQIKKIAVSCLLGASLLAGSTAVSSARVEAEGVGAAIVKDEAKGVKIYKYYFTSFDGDFNRNYPLLLGYLKPGKVGDNWSMSFGIEKKQLDGRMLEDFTPIAYVDSENNLHVIKSPSFTLEEGTCQKALKSGDTEAIVVYYSSMDKEKMQNL